MPRILIGNIKGPKGDTGARGATGPEGPVGPQGPLPPLTNNFLATVAGQAALDAVAGKTLKEQLDQQNSNLATANTKITELQRLSLRHETFVVNPAGSDYIDCPLKYKINAECSIVAFNGDKANFAGYVKSTTVDYNTNSARFYLSESKNGYMRINTLYWSIENDHLVTKYEPNIRNL